MQPFPKEQLTLHFGPCGSHPLIVAHPVEEAVGEYHCALDHSPNRRHALRNVFNDFPKPSFVGNVARICLDRDTRRFQLGYEVLGLISSATTPRDEREIASPVLCHEECLARPKPPKPPTSR